MLDFLMIATRVPKRGTVEIYPKFILKKSSDLMIRGGDFYAIWIEETGLWSTDEQDVARLIDKELDQYVKDNSDKFDGHVKVSHMWDADSGVIDRWHKYCQKQMRDNFHELDEKLIFSNMNISKKDYASKKLTYPLKEGPMPGYEKLISTLYTPEERHKLEWAIGSVIAGESKNIQKFMVLYGSAGTGKSTVLNIMQKLFDGYYAAFNARDLGSSSNAFALEAFRANPLVAIQHDGDLSRIEDNTRINSLVSHEMMTVNVKFKSTYSARFNAFLFVGTNKPVKITDAKSGIIRRLIDVSPSGNKLSQKEYKKAVKDTDFELGAIAYHCQEVYLKDPDKYADYIPVSMLGATNDFYNYVIDSYRVFKENDGVSLKSAWEMYKVYCEEAHVLHPLPMRAFGEELKNYFREFGRAYIDGSRIRSYYSGFKTDKFEDTDNDSGKDEDQNDIALIDFDCTESIFDSGYSECPAQYAVVKDGQEIPSSKWVNVTTKLSGLDTTKVHYVKLPENHIVIDFDIPDEQGNKDFEKNLREASKWPATYAELSKSGAGIHLHYIYEGDTAELSRLYADHVEIKVFTGNSSLRRKLTKCNNLPIATISSGLPLKGDKPMLNFEAVKNEKGIRTLIKKNLNKEIHPGTKPSIDFIHKILNDAYESGAHYDVSDMYNAVLAFAAQSTNRSEYCLKLVGGMKFKSDEPSMGEKNDGELVFFDVEVFPNLFLVNWKIAGERRPVVRMINPKPHEIEELVKHNLVGFNCRRYDNHVLYARMIGYNNEQIFDLSQNIVKAKKNNRNVFFGEAYNLSYTDVYDFASAGNKKSLKKFEIELDIHHKELGLPWDEPVPEERWEEVAEYCDNDVIATEAVFNYLKGDWVARQILADITGLSVNDTTNTLSQRIIFGTNRKPQGEFNYRNLAEPVPYTAYEEYRKKFGDDYKFRVWNDKGLPEYRDYEPGEKLPKGWSILPFFPGYVFEAGKSTYLGETIGEGGRVYAEPGMYGNVWDGDVASMHPSSVIQEMLFGVKYTKAFAEIVKGRLSIKHEAWGEVDQLFGGKLKSYIQKVIDGELTSKELANALKTVINSVYGLTSAHFENVCRDPRNLDNIVAKRGALFMTLLTKQVQNQNYTVCHNKTDSIKIPDASDSIKDFVIKFGAEYGYNFETEAEFDKFCLVNDAVYIAKVKDGDWTATGTQFAVPYVFKTLFSKEPIEPKDMVQTFSVTSALYLDMNEKMPDVSKEEKELDKLIKKHKKGDIDDATFASQETELKEVIATGHTYQFVGKIGAFCPIQSDKGGGVLYREQKGKYNAVSGTKGYRWLEAEQVLSGNEDIIDKDYYRKLVDDAVDTISKYGDAEWFMSDDPYQGSALQQERLEEILPF